MPCEPSYPELSAFSAGLRGKCPRCGRGSLFAGYLRVAARCRSCGLPFDFADAGDGAAWFVILFAGGVAIATALWMEFTWQPTYWVHAVAAVPSAIILPLVLLRPAKGLLLCRQWKTGAAEGRLSR